MWRIVDETDLAATIAQVEIDTCRASGSPDGSDPVARLIASTVAMARSYIASNGNVRLAPDPATLPVALIPSVMDIVAYRILKRIDDPGEARKAAHDEAMSMLKDIAARKLSCESDGAEESAATGGPAIEVVAEVRPRVTAAKLEGL